MRRSVAMQGDSCVLQNFTALDLFRAVLVKTTFHLNHGRCLGQKISETFKKVRHNLSFDKIASRGKNPVFLDFA